MSKRDNETKIDLIRKNCIWCGIICFICGIIVILEDFNIISLFLPVKTIIYTMMIVILPVTLFTCASNFWLQGKIKQKIEKQKQNVEDSNKYQ